MRNLPLKPAIMGTLMGLMMMWMLHGAMTGDAPLGAAALIAFVGAHLVIVVITAVVIWAGTRLSPRVHKMLSRLHRPSIAHVATMLGSAALVGVTVHLGLHGIGGI